jgi:hypothetical protein
MDSIEECFSMALKAPAGPSLGIRGEASVPRRMQKSRNASGERVERARRFEPERRIRGSLAVDRFFSSGP